jgi:hypothetical protein
MFRFLPFSSHRLTLQQDTEHGVCAKTCPGIAVATCQPVVTVVPPVCPDNCSSLGVCVNVTTCDELRRSNLAKYGMDCNLVVHFRFRLSVVVCFLVLLFYFLEFFSHS